MNPIHRLIRRCGRELQRSPRPLAYNWHARLRPSLGAILAYLKLARPDFFFIQVGAHDGKLADPIHPFVEQFRLRGLLLEPQPELFDALRKTYSHRADLVFVNAAIAPHDGRISMHRVRPSQAPEHWVTATASLRHDMLETIRHQVADLDGTSETIEVEAITPKSLLRQHGVTRFDLLQVDTQGFDYEVLKLFDFEKTLPAVIHFEHNMLSHRDWEQCIARLIGSGYRVSHTFEDTLACHRDVLPQE